MTIGCADEVQLSFISDVARLVSIAFSLGFVAAMSRMFSVKLCRCSGLLPKAMLPSTRVDV